MIQAHRLVGLLRKVSKGEPLDDFEKGEAGRYADYFKKMYGKYVDDSE